MGIDIKISKKFALTSDKNQFVLNKIRIADETKKDKDDNILVRKGDEIYSPVAYYSSLDSALKNAPMRIVMQSKATSFKELIRKYNKTIDNILGAKVGK